VVTKRKNIFTYVPKDSAGSEKMDRFIPYRMKENLQGKFEAVTVNCNEFLRTQENIPQNKQAYKTIFGSLQSSSSVLQLPQVTHTTAAATDS
jgi:hypothetical protein